MPGNQLHWYCQDKITTTQKYQSDTQNTKNTLKPCLVTSYVIRPRNRRQILIAVPHKFITYLLTCTLTAPGPTRGWSLKNCFWTNQGQCTIAHPAAESRAFNNWQVSMWQTAHNAPRHLSSAVHRPSWRAACNGFTYLFNG